MQPRVVNGIKSKFSTHQEVFVCVSVLIYACSWLPICIEKYPDAKINIGLDLLLFSFLAAVTGCLFFLVSIICDITGYQKASPLCLIVAICIGFVGQFLYDYEYCHAFFPTNYDICFVAECLSFVIYISTVFYLTSMILARTPFQIADTDLASIRAWFGPKNRIRVLFAINVSMLIIIFCHIHIYSYLEDLTFGVNVFDMIWVGFCTILVVISILLRIPMCVPFIAQRWLLLVLSGITLLAFGFGMATAWRYRITDLDGVARVGNVFIWCVVNLWVLIEFMTTDVKDMLYQTIQKNNSGRDVLTRDENPSNVDGVSV